MKIKFKVEYGFDPDARKSTVMLCVETSYKGDVVNHSVSTYFAVRHIDAPDDAEDAKWASRTIAHALRKLVAEAPQ